MIAIFIMSAKLATLGLLEIKVFSNKRFDVVTSVHDASNKIYHVTQIKLPMWSCHQSFVTLAFLGVALKLYTSVAKCLKLNVTVLGWPAPYPE